MKVNNKSNGKSKYHLEGLNRKEIRKERKKIIPLMIGKEFLDAIKKLKHVKNEY